MKRGVGLFEKLFALALRAYPKAYRVKFADEMLTVFSEILESAASKGFFALLIIFIREVRDVPSNALKQHLIKEAQMMRSFYSNTKSLTTRLVVGYGLGFFIANLLLIASSPLAKIISLMVARWASMLSLTYAFPTAETYRVEVSLVLWAGLMAIPGLILGLLLGQKKNLSKIMLVWGAAWILPAVFMTARLSHWFGMGTGSGQINYFTLDEFVMFMNCAGGAAIGYFVSLFISDRRKLPWFLLTGAIVYPIARELALNLTNVRLPAPENLRYVAFVMGQTGAYYAIVGLLLGMAFGIVSTLLSWRGEELQPA